MAKQKRKINFRSPAPDLILIVTEGEKTEPYYFESFRLHTGKVAIIKGTGTDPMSLIVETDKEYEKAKNLYQKEYGIKLKRHDIEVRCVFDKDSYPPAQFNDESKAPSIKAIALHIQTKRLSYGICCILNITTRQSPETDTNTCFQNTSNMNTSKTTGVCIVS